MAVSTENQNGFLKSTFPVLLPEHPALTYSTADFESFLMKDVSKLKYTVKDTSEHTAETDDDTTLVSEISTTGEVRHALGDLLIDGSVEEEKSTEHPFMKAISSANDVPDRDMTNMMQTENKDLAHRSTNSPLVDLFSELEEVVSGPRLRELLESAWQDNSLSTLKIIFNARSIHLGKSSRATTYKCFGWLAQNHPATLLTNLQWLTRPIIEKKLAEKKEGEGPDDMVLVEAEKAEDDPSRYDVRNGVAHGYWKDLLNILALTVDGKLDVLANPRDLLNIENKDKKGKKTEKVWDQVKAKEIRSQKKADRHTAATAFFNEQPFYRCLHLTIARLFADQLKSDLALLRSNDKKQIRQISLCAKWAPSPGLFHDKHTFICSSIAEIMHPTSNFKDVSDREVYLRYAREAYRKDISALRKALEVVERDIAAETFQNIKYDRVPSQAMNKYAKLFIQKDPERFDSYITKVASGKKTISGATLLPSKLVAAVRATQSRYNWGAPAKASTKKGTKGLIEAKMAETNSKVIDGQWNTLVKRIKESGKLENSIAVADVSGSMTSPTLNDGTTPMDTSIGLALLLAEITSPPFGGSFITFSTDPKVEKVEGETFHEKVQNLENADWGQSTDFVAVFERLILPMARKHNVKQEDMVKQIFVFSDMQFNIAAVGASKWSTSFERIKGQFELYGYEMPKLIFWNLAGGRAGVTGYGDPTAPKPVHAYEEGTALVSGYSQGMLKVFLDNGAFEDPEAEEEIVEEEVAGEDEDGEAVVQVKKKVKMDPMSTVRKAISHKAYSMLRVVD